ncbi:MAG: tagaturonate epimerase family protein [Ktedonobacterales bacterium]
MLHLKTASTSYVEALRLIARVAPDLFRLVFTIVREAYERDASSYHVPASVSQMPVSQADTQLVTRLDEPNTRQVLHFTFGSVLVTLRPQLLDTLREHEDRYQQTLGAHFVRHLEPSLAYNGK